MNKRIKLAAIMSLAFASANALAAEPQPIGKLVSLPGTVFQRSKPGEDWQVVPAKGDVYAGYLLLGLPGAAIETGMGDLRLKFLGDLDRNSPNAIFEPAVVLRAGKDRTVEVELDRGRIDLTNIKKEGKVHVGLRFRDHKWQATLESPETSILLELYGRWAKGTRFTTKPGPKDVPSADLTLVVRLGTVEVEHEMCLHAMSAPPGPALLHWESGDAHPEAPQKLDKLPVWASETYTSERAKRIQATLAAFRQDVLKSPPLEVLREYSKSEDAAKRSLAVVFMGAMDDKAGLGDVLTSTRYLDTWDLAVVVTRHWLGRRAGQDQLLYHYLVEKRGAKPAQAETTLQLMHSFSDEDLAQPEVYRMLVRYLDNDRLGIRGLAFWHLVRLVPDGREFHFDPLASKDERDKAIAQWKKLVEDKIAKGELPPKGPSSK
jgi:hypothetical protein